MGFHRNQRHSESLQISGTLLYILLNRNTAVLWMVSTRLLISKSSSSCINPLVPVPKCANCNWYHCHFHVPQIFSNSLARSSYICFFLLSFSFSLFLAGTATSTIRHFFCLFFFLTIIRSSRLAQIRWSVCISILSVSFTRTDSGLYIYYLFLWSNLKYLLILL